MTLLLEVALDQLRAMPEDSQNLWGARIINGLRGCPRGLEPGEFEPDDWGPDDEIWEALLAITTGERADNLERNLQRDRDADGGGTMTLDEFLERAEALDREDRDPPADDADGLPRLPPPIVGEGDVDAAALVETGAAA